MSETVPAPSEQSLERQALSALRAMRQKIDDLEASRREGIAIIGLACDFPGGVHDAESYWRLLSDQRCAIGEIPSQRIDIAAIFSPDKEAPGKTYSRWAGLLDQVDAFDAEFFGISPREARQTDPQQRIFLECVWHALEDAGIAPASLAGSTASVFVGATTHEYASAQTRSVAAHDIDRYSALGAALNAIAGRVSHVLGLHGPSMCIDTACSSSLVAVDRACRSLRDGECDLSIAGGVNVIAFGESLIAASRWGMLSSSGRVRSFGRGDGFVRGEGCGVVVLKRLSAAQRAGDRVLGVILGSSVNHDGPGSGLTVPNGKAQAMLLRAALASAGLAPSAVGYVEAHGTGTRLGDPIEAEALGEVFAGTRDAPLQLGSVKTNLGHLEAAAGIAGLIKLVLSLGHGQLPAQLQDGPLSEHVRWGELPLEVATLHRPWSPIAGHRIGGVSAFGFSGTNAHVIVEEPPPHGRREPGQEGEGEVLVLSAKSEAALDRTVERYIVHLAGHPKQNWGDVCHTAAVGRTHFKHRVAVVAETSERGLELLRAYASNHPSPGIERGQIQSEDRPSMGVLLGGGIVTLPPDGRMKHAQSLGEEYVAGLDVDWAVWNEGRVRHRVALPGYSFARQRHWFTPSAPQLNRTHAEPSTARSTGHPLLGRQMQLAGEGKRYEQLFRVASDSNQESDSDRDVAWLREHRIQGNALMPATALIEIMLAAGDRISGHSEPQLEDVVFPAPMSLESSRLMQVSVDLPETALPETVGLASRETLSSLYPPPPLSSFAGGGGSAFAAPGEVHPREVHPLEIRSKAEPGSISRTRVRIYSTAADDLNTLEADWILHAEGYVRRRSSDQTSDQAPTLGSDSPPLDEIRNRCSEVIEAEPFYASMRMRGADFGPRFQGIERVWRRPGEALGQVRIDCLGKRLHPASFDACLQIATAAMYPLHDNDGSEALLPFHVAKLDLLSSPIPHETCFVHAELLSSANPKHTRFQITLLAPTPEHTPIASLTLELAQLPNTKIRPNRIYETEWLPGAQRENDLISCSGCWLILADLGGVGGRLGHEISMLGGSCFFISPGEGYSQLDGKHFTARLTSRDDFARILRSLPITTTKLRIVHLGSLDAPCFDNVDAHQLLASQQLGYGSCLALTQAVEVELHSSLFLITRSAKPSVSTKSTTAGPALWAMRGAIRAEHPNIFVKSVDLAGDAGEIPISRVLLELQSKREPEVALNTYGRLVPRLAVQLPRPALDHGTAVELKLGRGGSLDDLHHKPVARLEPADGEVEIEVHAAGLNFRDVLNALGMMPVADTQLGGECAGIVARAGRDAGFNPGDEVLVFASGLFRSYVTVMANSVFLKPAGLNFEQAATLPVAYLTAIFALARLAKLRRGETILIHAAAGGLGQAAVAVAKMLGARIYATAGNEEKRQCLRNQGVEVVMDSRSLEFGDQMLHATEGRGVDVILNSLGGAFIDESLRVLAPNGRFLEAGKRSVLSHEEVTRRRPDGSYFLFDLGSEAEKQPGLIRSLMNELASYLGNKVLGPLPVRSFPSEDAANAFRIMAQARHIGKLAITYEHPWRLHSGPATYLITGGLGSLGLRAAEWLLRCGARSLILVSRQRHPESEEAVSRMRAVGASINLVYADAAQLEGVQTAMMAVSAQAPLRGIIHCAGVLHDATLMNQTWDSFREVAQAKIVGAWNLHTETKGMLLDFFITFSSAAAIVGSAGQANYVAANAAMDALAQLRRSQGLPALSINWGPWQGEGMASRSQTNLRHPGLQMIEAISAFKTVEDLLSRRTPQAMVLPPGHGTAWLSSRDESGDDIYLAALKCTQPPSGLAIPMAKPAAVKALPEMTRARLIECIQDDFAKVSGLNNPVRFTDETAFSDAGLDSLMAVELRNALMKSLGRNLPATVALDYPTVGELADYLLPRKSRASVAVATRGRFEAAVPVDAIFESLSEEEAEALLLQEIDRGTA